ncbi:MAPEG family protein [Caldimonas brevitalea]|uniref:Membrane protein n=1 Tax=Caldimonas brevitalea TaxID=413882 RepID=A0A0G3BKV0_9BURK|nr:MAPEG family protein [Caldimonas brevitalea]AKJ28613.1 membrane protein [Caldimonas brevitalea]
MKLTVTLATAVVCVLFYLVLSLRVVSARRASRFAVTGPVSDVLTMRIRTHANFAEYVPLALLMLGLLELAGAAHTALVVLGALLVAARLLHAYGLPRPAPNPWRFLGTVGTFGVLLAESVLALQLLLA